MTVNNRSLPSLTQEKCALTKNTNTFGNIKLKHSGESEQTCQGDHVTYQNKQ